jgi:hypothetical protein
LIHCREDHSRLRRRPRPPIVAGNAAAKCGYDLWLFSTLRDQLSGDLIQRIGGGIKRASKALCNGVGT